MWSEDGMCADRFGHAAQCNAQRNEWAGAELPLSNQRDCRFSRFDDPRGSGYFCARFSDPGSQVMTQTQLTFFPVVVTPTYNNARTLIDVLDRIVRLKYAIDCGQRRVHRRNLLSPGKVDAFSSPVRSLPFHRTAARRRCCNRVSRRRSRLGYTHALTIDTDGQLDPEQIPELLARPKNQVTRSCLCARDTMRSDYPAKSRVGRRVSNTMIWMESTCA